MPNLAAILKEEVRRLAKREIKAATAKTKKAVTQYRFEIAKLKRMIQAQEKKTAALVIRLADGNGQSHPTAEAEEKIRFSARSVRAQRNRLGLSAENYAKLVGVSPLTIYGWEHGKSRPRKAQLAALVAVRGIGKRQAMAKLEVFKGEKKQGRKGVRNLAGKKPR